MTRKKKKAAPTESYCKTQKLLTALWKAVTVNIDAGMAKD